MLKTIRIILAIIVVMLAGFSMITQNFEFMPLLMLILALTMFITGIMELQKTKKRFWGYVSIGASLFVLYVSVEGFLMI
ncbi:DUF3953 domain-containing protein [Alkalihalobacillus sp. MEB130]|uniref:DUF3953 domain-containing protein n=1 Tax=Alkalihalobacillus sp. MEB130 TaxID=2976704 RepID=UPI0028DE20E5|nr:DUF3953 domain-containing protein [Alkalihalobacillus sp. MEB130]MDT8860362.1 DUF3953 domain-containing protein [Alkalihalobacillus sp. MEB130]